MTMSGRSNLLPLLLIGGAGWWAWEQGYIGPLVDQVKDLIGGEVSDEAETDQGDEPEATPVAPAAVVEPEVVPSGMPGPSNIATLEILREHWVAVQPWARANPIWVAAMMHQESGGRSNVTSHQNARGILQVLPTTAWETYRAGFRDYDPDNLYDTRTGIYFGTAFLERVSRWKGIPRARQWITRAYHGGPDGEHTGHWGPINRQYIASITAINARFERQLGV